MKAKVNFLKNFEQYNKLLKPVVITIGFFDGVHLGHKFVLNKVIEAARALTTDSVLLTFKNHPLELLKGTTVPKLTSVQHKTRLVEEEGICSTLLLDFTKEFSEQTAEVFLKTLHQSIPFTKLILGHDSALGKNREGNRNKVNACSKKYGFEVEYLPIFSFDQNVVSSSEIRKYIQNGDFVQAQKLLGREWSVYSPVQSGAGKGKTLGFPTANIDVTGLCLPPFGVYAVKVIIDKKAYTGVANLGFAPTLRTDNKPLLEVHIFDCTEDLHQKNIEVIPKKFIRPEMHFEGIKELKSQISNDITFAKKILQGII
jgi:riboflavin kinase / FMN adenylyltransferase